MTHFTFQTASRWSLLLAVALPPALVLCYVAVLRLVGIGTLGPAVDTLAQLAGLCLGYTVLTRRYERRVWVALVYFPVMLALTWGITFAVTTWLRWYEY